MAARALPTAGAAAMPISATPAATSAATLRLSCSSTSNASRGCALRKLASKGGRWTPKAAVLHASRTVPARLPVRAASAAASPSNSASTRLAWSRKHCPAGVGTTPRRWRWKSATPSPASSARKRALADGKARFTWRAPPVMVVRAAIATTSFMSTRSMCMGASACRRGWLQDSRIASP
jgi:hypothetical protein